MNRFVSKLVVYLSTAIVLATATLGYTAPSETYRKIDPNYRFFHFTGDVFTHTSEVTELVYEAPHGQIYDGGSFQHAEDLWIDFRYFAIDFLGLKNIPATFGMSYLTYVKDPYPDSFQVNRVSTSLITPKIYGFSLEYQVDALSNSGRQGAAQYWNLYYENNFGLIPNPQINLISFRVSYCTTNGLGWIGLTPKARGVNVTAPGCDWAFLFTNGYMWSASKGMLGDITIDTRPLGHDAYVSARFDTYWNDDPTQPAQCGQSYFRYGVFYGNTFSLLKALELQGEVGVERFNTLTIFKAKLGLCLSTNFQ